MCLYKFEPTASVNDNSYPKQKELQITLTSKYGNIPLWVTTSVLTFGSLSKMYNVLAQSLRSKICRHFPNVNQRQLERFLSVLTKYRNVCAHGDKFFSYRTVDQILDTPLHSKLSIPQQGNIATSIAFEYFCFHKIG